MKKLLVTGGTVFVSKYVAEYFSNKNEYEVFVLNRNNHPQPANGSSNLSLIAFKISRPPFAESTAERM